MAVLPASLLEPLWVEFAALIGSADQPEFCPSHPWGCHRPRVPDRIVSDHVIAALVHGTGHERLTSPGCSDRTIWRRLVEWAKAGVGEALARLGLVAYDQMIGLDLDDLAVDGSITKSLRRVGGTTNRRDGPPPGHVRPGPRDVSPVPGGTDGAIHQHCSLASNLRGPRATLGENLPDQRA